MTVIGSPLKERASVREAWEMWNVLLNIRKTQQHGKMIRRRPSISCLMVLAVGRSILVRHIERAAQ